MTLNLDIRGLAYRDPLRVELPPRAVLLGPNGVGKSTILNAIRLAAAGEAEIKGVGSTPGALTALSANGGIDIALEIPGVDGVTTSVKTPRQTKVDTLRGFECRFANVALGGSAEELRAFFAKNVKPTAEWTRDAAGKAIARRVAPAGVELPVASSVVESLNRALLNAKEKSKEARKVHAQLKAAAEGAIAAIAKDPTSPAKPLPELEKEAAQLSAEIEGVKQSWRSLAEEHKRYDSARLAADNSAARLESQRKTPPLPAPALELAAANAELEGATKECDEVAADTNARELELKEREAHVVAREIERGKATALHCAQLAAEGELGNGNKCPLCEGFVGDIARGRMALRVREAEIHANEKDAELKTAEGERDECAASFTDVYNRMAELESKRRAIHRRVENLTQRCENAKIALAKYSEVLTQLEANANEAARALAVLAQPQSGTELSVKLNELEAKCRDLDAPIAAARRREQSRMTAANQREQAEKAQQSVEGCVALETAIRDVRNEVVNSSLAALREATASVAFVLGAGSVIDLGDEERSPTIGIDRDGRTVPFTVLSEGQRAIFLAGLAAALLEQSDVPVERRILLLEAGAIDLENLQALLKILADRKIGHIVVAWQIHAGMAASVANNLSATTGFEALVLEAAAPAPVEF
jgi:chromosome segregation ATPase